MIRTLIANAAYWAMITLASVALVGAAYVSDAILRGMAL